MEADSVNFKIFKKSDNVEATYVANINSNISSKLGFRNPIGGLGSTDNCFWSTRNDSFKYSSAPSNKIAAATVANSKQIK